MTLKSSFVTWSLVATFVIGGLNSVVNVVPPMWAVIISGIIGALGLIVHNDQIKTGKVA